MDNSGSKKSSWESILDVLGLGGANPAPAETAEQAAPVQADPPAASFKEPSGPAEAGVRSPENGTSPAPTSGERSGRASRHRGERRPSAWEDPATGEAASPAPAESGFGSGNLSLDPLAELLAGPAAEDASASFTREPAPSKAQLQETSGDAAPSDFAGGGRGGSGASEKGSKPKSRWSMLAEELNLPPTPEEEVDAGKPETPQSGFGKPAASAKEPLPWERGSAEKPPAERSGAPQGRGPGSSGPSSRGPDRSEGPAARAPEPRSSGPRGAEPRGDREPSEARTAARVGGPRSGARGDGRRGDDRRGGGRPGRGGHPGGGRGRAPETVFDDFDDLPADDPILNDLEGFGDLDLEDPGMVSPPPFVDEPEVEGEERLDSSGRRKRRRRGRGKGPGDQGSEAPEPRGGKPSRRPEVYEVDDDPLDDLAYPREVDRPSRPPQASPREDRFAAGMQEGEPENRGRGRATSPPGRGERDRGDRDRGHERERTPERERSGERFAERSSERPGERGGERPDRGSQGSREPREAWGPKPPARGRVDDRGDDQGRRGPGPERSQADRPTGERSAAGRERSGGREPLPRDPRESGPRDSRDSGQRGAAKGPAERERGEHRDRAEYGDVRESREPRGRGEGLRSEGGRSEGSRGEGGRGEGGRSEGARGEGRERREPREPRERVDSHRDEVDSKRERERPVRPAPVVDEDQDNAEIVVRYRGIASWQEAILPLVDGNIAARDRGERRENRRFRGRGGRGGGGGGGGRP